MALSSVERQVRELLSDDNSGESESACGPSSTDTDRAQRLRTAILVSLVGLVALVLILTV